jgi:hypothetical protein
MSRVNNDIFISAIFSSGVTLQIVASLINFIYDQLMFLVQATEAAKLKQFDINPCRRHRHLVENVSPRQNIDYSRLYYTRLD